MGKAMICGRGYDAIDARKWRGAAESKRVGGAEWRETSPTRVVDIDAEWRAIHFIAALLYAATWNRRRRAARDHIAHPQLCKQT